MSVCDIILLARTDNNSAYPSNPVSVTEYDNTEFLHTIRQTPHANMGKNSKFDITVSFPILAKGFFNTYHTFDILPSDLLTTSINDLSKSIRTISLTKIFLLMETGKSNVRK
jgi:hypothetical protein